jgi:hypothetical protein
LYKNFSSILDFDFWSKLQRCIKIPVPASENNLSYQVVLPLILIGWGLLPIIWDGFWPKWAIWVSKDILSSGS